MTKADNSKLSKLIQILKNPSYSLNPNHLCTNTWKSRRLSNLMRLEEVLYNWNFRDITILDIGPGGVAEKYASQLPEFDEEDLEMKKKHWSRILNARETRERNKPYSLLTCFEPSQIYAILSRRIRIKHMYVGDKYQRVLDGVERLKLPNVSTHLIDFSKPLPQDIGIPQVDVVIEFNVENYGNDVQQIRENVSNLNKPRGILARTIHDNVIPFPGYTLLKPNVYLKGSRPDKKTGWYKRPEGLSEHEIQMRLDELTEKEGPYKVAL